jgi:hypothetical protein
MEHWSVKHCIVAVELFIKTESVTPTKRGFRQQFQILQYQTTSAGVTSKARYTKHVLPILMT